MKRLWRCHVCNDMHWGNAPPEVCPTCGATNSFVPSDLGEALEIIGRDHPALDDREGVLAAWQWFSDQSPTVRLTAKADEMELLCKGVLENLRTKGQRYCPCRLPTGDREKDEGLICPCNFLRQPTFKETGECWCGLFVRRGTQ